MDVNRSGYLDMNEYKQRLLDLNDIEVLKAFVTFDRNNNGQIAYDEFLILIRRDI